MIVCESEFKHPDPKNPNYAMTEIDIYGGVGFYDTTHRVPRHRLTLRKNLAIAHYEVYRFFLATRSITVACSTPDLQEALNFADTQLRKYLHRSIDERELDRVCQHRAPIKAVSCEVET